MTRRKGTTDPFRPTDVYVLRGADLDALWERHRDEWISWHQSVRGEWTMPDRWWVDEAGEIFWMEITDRDDLGVDLNAPASPEGERPRCFASRSRARQISACLNIFLGRLSSILFG